MPAIIVDSASDIGLKLRVGRDHPLFHRWRFNLVLDFSIAIFAWTPRRLSVFHLNANVTRRSRELGRKDEGRREHACGCVREENSAANQITRN